MYSCNPYDSRDHRRVLPAQLVELHILFFPEGVNEPFQQSSQATDVERGNFPKKLQHYCGEIVAIR
jgi:hypothetical protein